MDTPGTNTTAPSIDDNFDGYGDEEEEEEEGGEKDDVIRLEIGGENEEEKAKRIALAMRKWVTPHTGRGSADEQETHDFEGPCDTPRGAQATRRIPTG